MGLLPLLHNAFRDGSSGSRCRPLGNPGRGLPTWKSRRSRGGVADGGGDSQRGRFGSAHRAPPTPADPALWPPDDFDVLVQAFAARGFRGPCAWYTNDDANTAYARTAPNGGHLSQPVLFVNGEWDPICSITGNRQGDPMRAACADLTVTNLTGGHWLPVECKDELTETIRSWLRSKDLGP